MSDDASSPARAKEGAQQPSLGDSIRSWLRGLTGGEQEGSGRERLDAFLEGHEAELEAMEPGQREMLLNILSFNELQVDDMMIPRAEIDAVEIDTPLEGLIARFRAVKHSRLPVYRETLDEIVGFVHIKDVFDYWHEDRPFRIEDVLRQTLVVPPSMGALDLLALMRQTRVHMAVVVDEYGGSDGLITIEDVVEEIVGDIADEHEDEEIGIRELPDGSFDVDARTEIEEFEDRFGVTLLEEEDEEDLDTLAGFVFSRLGRMPRPGEKLALPEQGLEIEVVEVDPRRIRRLKVRRQGDGPAPGG